MLYRLSISFLKVIGEVVQTFGFILEAPSLADEDEMKVLGSDYELEFLDFIKQATSIKQ